MEFDWCTSFASRTVSKPQLSSVTLQFEGGALLTSPPTPPIATGGVWITQPANCTWCVRVVGDRSQQILWPVPPQTE